MLEQVFHAEPQSTPSEWGFIVCSPWARRLGVKEVSGFGEAHARSREAAKRAGTREGLVFASSLVSYGKSLRVSLAAFSSPSPWLMALEGRDSGKRACNPSGVGMRDLAYPGCASRPRAIGFNASGVVPIGRGMKLRRVRPPGLKGEFPVASSQIPECWRLATGISSYAFSIPSLARTSGGGPSKRVRATLPMKPTSFMPAGEV